MKDANQGQAEQRFSEHFHALTDHLSEAELSIALGRSIGAVRGLRGGPTKMLKLDVALRLCRYLVANGMNVTPWDLMGETPPTVAAASATPAVAPDRLQSLEHRVNELTTTVRKALGIELEEAEAARAASKSPSRRKARARS
jgi:hypothetical protein